MSDSRPRRTPFQLAVRNLPTLAGNRRAGPVMAPVRTASSRALRTGAITGPARQDRTENGRGVSEAHTPARCIECNSRDQQKALACFRDGNCHPGKFGGRTPCTMVVAQEQDRCWVHLRQRIYSAWNPDRLRPRRVRTPPYGDINQSAQGGHGPASSCRNRQLFRCRDRDLFTVANRRAMLQGWFSGRLAALCPIPRVLGRGVRITPEAAESR